MQIEARPGAAHASPSAIEAVMRWLVPLRFLAAAGQAGALLTAWGALALPLPYAALWPAPLLTLATNLLLQVERVRRQVPTRVLVPAILLFDCMLFTIMLQLSGGPDNPLSALYAIHVAMAAMTGSTAATWAIAAASAICYALAFRWHLTQHFWHEPVSPALGVGLHAVGMWVAVVVVSVTITSFIIRVTRTLREREAALRQLGEVAARNARLASLTTLAAGAAHELGSPLGTIAVIARDLERAAELQLPPASLADDARLLRSEIERCRSILDRMRARAAHEARGTVAPLLAGDVARALREMLGDREALRVGVVLRAPVELSLGPQSDFLEIVQPILRNALEASPEGTRVDVEVAVAAGRLSVTVRDEGHGMDPTTLERVGEPFFTTRAPGKGTGLGLFVVSLHVERLGGSLRLASSPGLGTTAVVEWPLEAAELDTSGAAAERLAS